MISSTIKDLPEHREKVRDGCLRQEFFPGMMENWPALDADGITASLEAVDKADVYIGIFGFRYGYVPPGSELSITEMEYNRATERNIPRLIFLMNEEHALTVHEVDRGERATQLEKLRERLKAERTVSFFTSPADLQAKLIDTLSAIKVRLGIATTPIQIPSSSFDPRHPSFSVPFRSKGDQVIGRQAALDAVREQLLRGYRTAIGQTASFAGLGGLGKTQLAVEYAYAFRDQYPNGIIWISADQDIDRQLIEIGEKARWFPLESEHKDKIAIAKQRLKTYSHVLVIFDNLQDIKSVEDYLPDPEAEPHILVTSRSEHASFIPVPLDLLGTEQSLQLLIQEAGRIPNAEPEKQAAKEIAEKLGGLPLALELAGAYLRHRPTPWEKYRDLLTHDLKAALPAKFLRSSFTRHETDLYSTLRVNAEIFFEEPRLKDILDILTWSGPGPMGVALLTELLGIQETDLTNALGLGVILRLMRKVSGMHSYLMHQLVRDVRRGDLPLDERPEWILKTAERLVSWFQKHKRNFADLPKFEAEMEHLTAWWVNLGVLSPKLASRCVWLQAYPPFHRGNYKESLNFLLQARNLLERADERDAELEGNLLTDLCTIRMSLGEYQIAKECGLAAVELRLSLYGENHVDTAMSFNNLGGVLRALNDIQGGLTFNLRALKVWREMQGEDHIDTATALDQVSMAHLQLQNTQLALEFAEKAFSVRKKVLGLSHPDTAYSLSSLGCAYLQDRNIQKALECQQRANEISEELFGKRSVQRSAILKNMGLAYHEAKDFRPALSCFEESLEIRRELFGDRHPDTVRVAVDFAFTCCRAMQVHKGHQIIEEWQKKITSDHVLHDWFKESRRNLQRQFPRPGFRQRPRGS